MAAQCGSPRCTAERKGFRRELDSWRHRLIHCVGFESILEGLYGPGLRRDLSLFDDCEPEELVDWCVDEKCSLCSLRKETVDCTQSGGSAQSSPTGEVISQGQFNTEKIECQAEKYLNALFQKKDLPQNCDPNIPLVAQELMKKMIRQFAIEYVSKSRKMYQDNGTIVDTPRGCNGIQLNQTESLNPEDQDSPLDLTVTRIQGDSFHDEDGVLDLSVKRNGNGLDRNSKSKNLKLDAKNGYFLRKLKKVTERPKENTALTKVLATYCFHHQQQLVLMLKFIREEQKTCSQICCDYLQISEPAESTKKTKITPAIFYPCTKEKPNNCVSLKKQVSSTNLPYLSVRLKDLRLTWPNLALGTVKLNPIKHEDLHLRSNDQVLHCINTRSKKKKLFIHCCSRYRAISCSSSLPRLKLQRIATCLDGGVSKCHLKYCNQAASPVCLKKQSCQTDATNKTVTKSPNTKDPSCDFNGKQKNLMPTDNNATSQRFRDRCKIGSVHFGNLIKHLLNNSKTNHFVELLNQDSSNLDNKGIQTRLRKRQQKSPMFECSLSSSQSLEFTSKLNFCDAFPKEKIDDRDSRNSDKNMAIGAKKQNGGDILVMEYPENTPTESTAQQSKTKLPHSKSKIHSKNVNCVKNSKPCLPEGSTFSAAENVNTHKRRFQHDSFVECDIPFKRNSKNILGKCKLCDVTHDQCSVPSNNNLFCKCTIKHNSGIFKNFKIDRLVGRNTTDKAKNAHLKIVVKRLENAICSGTHNSERSCETTKNQGNLGKELDLPIDKLLINLPTSARSNNYLSLRSSTRKNQSDSALSPTSVSYKSTSCGISENTYLSPIKLMFVSKIESEDGVKYALSPVHTPFDNSDHQSLAALRKKSHDAPKINPNFLNPRCEIITPSSPSEAYRTTENHQENSNMVRRKWLGSIRVGHQSIRNIRKSAVESRSNSLEKKKPVEMKNDLKISIPCKASTSVTYPKIADHLLKSRITETYIAKNISSTQIKIQKLHRNLDSSVASDFTDVGLAEDHTRPLERENCKTSLRLSTRLQTPGNSYTVPNLCVVNKSGSEQEKLKNKTKSLSNVQRENNNTAQNLKKCQAEQNRIPKPKLGKRKILNSQLIRKQTLSNYMTRSKKSPLFSLYCGSQPTFSVRCALLHKSKKRSFVKNQHYRKKLRSYKQQCKPSITELKHIEDKNMCTSKYPDLQADPAIEWWSSTTTHGTLLNHLERRYEHIANTWVTDNVKKTHGTQLSPCCKFPGSESRSSVQILFQKKCDMKDLATWFMQTTETQSLEIVRKSNACRPRHRITQKGSRKKTKQPSNNYSISKKHLNRCSQQTQSSTLEELQVSKFVFPESVSLNTRKHRHKHNPEMNSLQCSGDQTKDVCVKFSYPGQTSNLTKLCTLKVINAAEPTVRKTLQFTKDDPKDSHADSSSQISSKPHIKALRENEPRRSTRRRGNKLGNKDYNVFLPKRSNKERKILPLNNKYTVKSGLGLNACFSTKYSLRLGKGLSNHQHIKKMNKLKRRYKMCLRNLRRTVVECDSHCNTSVLEERKKHMKVAFYLEKNKNHRKEYRPITGKMNTEYTEFQMGPLKPVGFPATRGLISKFGSYSLTPIRIPLK